MKDVKWGNSQRKKIAKRSPEAGGTERTRYCFMGTEFLFAAMKTVASGDVCTTLGMLLMQLNCIFKND